VIVFSIVYWVDRQKRHKNKADNSGWVIARKLFQNSEILIPRPHAGQLKLLKARNRFNVVPCGRRWGKTLFGQLLTVLAALPPDGSAPRPVGWFVPRYKLLKEVWRDLSLMLGPAIVTNDRTEKRMLLANGALIEGWSFDRDPDAGRSRRYGLVIIDEAALSENLEVVWRSAIRPTLADYKGSAWFLSSPRGKNFFHALFQRGTDSHAWPDWTSFTASTYGNPFIDPAEIDEAKADLGPQFFRQEYLAEFLDDLHEQLIPSAWLDLAAAAEYQPGGPRRQAIDLGGGRGGDRTVIGVRDDNGLRELKYSRDWPFETTATQAAISAQKHEITGQRTSFDAVGIGLDFGNRLNTVGLRGAVGYVAGSMRSGTSCAGAVRRSVSSRRCASFWPASSATSSAVLPLLARR
jgi:hypothetical protein